METEYSASEILKMVNDTKLEHDNLKETILQDINAVEEIEIRINENISKLEVLENNYVDLIEILENIKNV